jgi:hypothetical protein
MLFAATVTITQFFVNLFNDVLAPTFYAIATFFFGWGCIGLMFPGQRGQEQAKENIYRILGALALGLLTAVIAGALYKAAGGTPHITTTP